MKASSSLSTRSGALLHSEVAPSYGQGCPIAIALDSVGDRWTLLILRDLAHAPLRFTDLQAINPGLSPNLLVSRLRRLEAIGIVERRLLPPPARVTVYALSDAGRAAVLPVLTALGRLGGTLLDGIAGPPDAGPLIAQLRRNGLWALAKGMELSGDFVLDFDGTRVGLSVDDTTFLVSESLPREPLATIRTDAATMARLANAAFTVGEAEAAGQLRIDGDRAAALGLLRVLALDPLDS